MIYEEEYITTTSEGYDYEETMEFVNLFDKRSAPDYTESDARTQDNNQSYTDEFIEKINSTTYLPYVRISISKNIYQFYGFNNKIKL